MNKDIKKITALYEEYVLKMVNINTTPDDYFDPNELRMGIDVEKEHTDDLELAKSIAKDHLLEISDYYTKLKAMEGGKDGNAVPIEATLTAIVVTKEDIDHHCIKNICPECEGVSTCRCNKPKTIITHDVCPFCKGLFPK